MTSLARAFSYLIAAQVQSIGLMHDGLVGGGLGELELTRFSSVGMP